MHATASREQRGLLACIYELMPYVLQSTLDMEQAPWFPKLRQEKVTGSGAERGRRGGNSGHRRSVQAARAEKRETPSMKVKQTV